LASQIDRGIKRKLKEKESPRAKQFRKIHSTLKPFKYLVLFCYVFLLTQFERPDWCNDIVWKKYNGTVDEKETYKEWDDVTCNDREGYYTNSDLPKLEPVITWCLEIFCLFTLITF
jgi:hypothetical protein